MRKIVSSLKDGFIPHEGNDKQPHILRHKSVTRLVALILVIELFVLVGLSPIFSKGLDFIAAVLPSVLVDEANHSRTEYNLPTLTTNPLLVEAAQLKANDMASRGYFAHNTPEGLEPWVFLERVGYRYQSAGENLAVNFSDSFATHHAWMNSPGHRENILRGNFTEIGIATARGIYQGRETIFVAQFFGRPQVSVVEVPTPVVVEEEAVVVKPIEEAEEVFEPVVTEVPTVPDVATEVVTRSFVDSLAQSLVTVVDTFVEVVYVMTGNPMEDTELAELPNDQTVQGNSTFISTEDSVPVVAKVGDTYNDQASVVDRMISSPLSVAAITFGTLSLLLIVALVLKVFVHIRTQYFKLILNGLLVLIILFSLLLINHEIAIYLGRIV